MIVILTASTPFLPFDQEDAGQQNQRRGQRARRWNNAASMGGSPGHNANAKYPTRNKELPENLVFDNTGQNDAANFQCSLKGMANFMHTTYSAEVAKGILKMQAVTIPIEEEPKAWNDPDTGQPLPLTSWDEHKWKQTYNKQMAKLKIYKDSMPKAYIHLYNQCSTNLKNDLEASTAFPRVESTKDLIGLLKLIQGLCCSYDSKTQSVMATMASQKKLFTFFSAMAWTTARITESLSPTLKPSKLMEALVPLGLLPHSLLRSFTRCTRPGIAMMLRILRQMNLLLPTSASARNF